MGNSALPWRGAYRLQQGRVATERHFHRSRVEPLEEVADGGVRGRPLPLQCERGIQPAAMDGDEGDDVTIRVAAGHDGEDGEQQHVG